MEVIFLLFYEFIITTYLITVGMLPNEILVKIFNSLDWRELIKLTKVCLQFEQLIKFYPWHHQIELTDIDVIGSFIETYHFDNYKIRRIATDDLLEQLDHVRILDISWSYHITHTGLAHLSKLHTLDLRRYNVTDAGLIHLSGIKTLNLSECFQITDAGLAYLSHLHTLNLYRCLKITNAGLVHLSGLHTLKIICCEKITDDGLIYLSKIETLYLSGHSRAITDHGLAYLSGVHTLFLSFCREITDAGLAHLSKINTLVLSRCDLITDKGLEYLTDVHKFIFRECDRVTKEESLSFNDWAKYYYWAGICS